MRKIILFVSALALAATSVAQVTVASKNGDFKLRVLGRTNLDAGFNVATSDENIGYHNGVSIDDTRLGVSASFDEKWSAKFEIKYADGAISFTDVFVGYDFNQHHALKVGNFWQPFGTKILGSLGYKFIENATVDAALDFDARRIGLAYYYTSDRFNATVGVFSDGKLSSKKADLIDQGYSGSAKLIARPVLQSDDNGKVQQVFHVGVASAYTSSKAKVGISGKNPVTFGKAKTFVNTLSFDPENTVRGELELLYINRRFYGEAHYQIQSLNVHASKNNGIGQNFFAQGAFAQVGYLLIGEQQNYNKKTALAAAASPKSLELLARVDYLSLDHDDYVFGQQTDFTLGLNYYFNKYLNFRLNYIYATINGDREHGVANNDYHTIQGRLQFSF